MGEPTAYHFSSRLEVMEKATKIPSHSLVLGTCFVSNFYNYKLKTPFVHRSIKITCSFCLAKKQSIRVKVKMESARMNNWGCCHQKDLQFIAMCFQHDPGKTSNLNAQRGTPSCQTIVTPPKLKPSPGFAIITWNNPQNWRNPESPRDNTWQSLGLILSCNKVPMVDPDPSPSKSCPYQGTDLKPMPFAPMKRFSRARLVDLSISQIATTFFSYRFRW